MSVFGRSNTWKKTSAGVLLFAPLALAGCHARTIDATVTNATGAPISEVEIDYPSASFGTSALAAGASYHYRFEIIGNGPLKATWTDAARKPHAATGPTINEGDHGSLSVSLSANGTATWQPSLTR